MSKTHIPPSKETLKEMGIKFVPTNCYAAVHPQAKHIMYPFEGFDTYSEYDAMKRASLTNQIALSLEHNNMLNQKDVLIPAAMRLLGYK